MSGTCILASGPADVSSIKYLSDNNAAYCITSKEKLSSGLSELLTNEDIGNTIVKNALELANKNHKTNNNFNVIYGTIKSTENQI